MRPDGKEQKIAYGSTVGTVSDTGKGIPEGFDWRNSPSPGLGLVISLVEQPSGTIELLPGPGTTFRIMVQKKGG